jgi:hypothetical protein
MLESTFRSKGPEDTWLKVEVANAMTLRGNWYCAEETFGYCCEVIEMMSICQQK